MSADDEEHDRYRRVDDEKINKISRLIEQEDDPKVRGTLTLIQCLVEEILDMNIDMRRIGSTIKVTKSIADAHEKLVQRVAGAMAIVLVIIGPVQVIALGATGYMFTTVDSLKREVVMVTKENEKLDAKLQALYKRDRINE